MLHGVRSDGVCRYHDKLDTERGSKEPEREPALRREDVRLLQV